MGSEEGSTLSVRENHQQQQQQQQQDDPAPQPRQPQHRVFDASNIVHSMDQKTSKQQAWFQQPSKKHLEQASNEAYIESQVLRLTDECRLFQETENEDEASFNPALFHRHEVQNSWNMIGKGAFSEVYMVQKLYLLDESFVDEKQKESRKTLQENCLTTKDNVDALNR